MSEKLKELAKVIVNYSLNVKKNEKVMINTGSLEARELILYLIDEIYAKGAIPFVKVNDAIIANKIMESANDKRIDEIEKMVKHENDLVDCFVHIIYHANDYESKNVSPDFKKSLATRMMPYDNVRTNERKWVVLNYPSNLDAYKAKMTTEEFKKYAMEVMCIDYKELSELVKPLKKLMEKTDKVRIKGKKTDLTFSIKGIPVVPCTGEMNLPDGEVYTAPVRDSINGKITFNTDCPHSGTVFQNVSLEFKDGKIVKATCDENEEKLNKILDTDEGARHIGEFALGLNPKILKPMGDILYDEKILGSIHLALGRCYKDADNKNESGIHWDMVLIQRKEYGGGEIYFDDVLVRKDGKFVPKELKALNFD